MARRKYCCINSARCYFSTARRYNSGFVLFRCSLRAMKEIQLCASVMASRCRLPTDTTASAAQLALVPPGQKDPRRVCRLFTDCHAFVFSRHNVENDQQIKADKLLTLQIPPNYRDKCPVFLLTKCPKDYHPHPPLPKHVFFLMSQQWGNK